MLSAPVAIAIDAVTFLVSAVLLGSIRAEEPPPPPPSDREPVLHEIRDGLRLVPARPDPAGVRRLADVDSTLWGVFGTTWFLFVLDELGLGPAVLGVVAAVGGVSSFVGAVVAGRVDAALGDRPVAIAAMILSTVGNAVHPAGAGGAPLVAIALPGHAAARRRSAVTVYDITEVVVRQTLVHDRALGRVTSTFSGGRCSPSWSRRCSPACWPRSSACAPHAGSPRSAASSASPSCGARRSATLEVLAGGEGRPPDRGAPSKRSSATSPVGGVGEERLHEGVGVEGEEVAGLLADADEADRDLEGVLDGEDDPALGRRVELGQDDPGEPDRLVERLRLGEAVLAGRRVEHEQRLRARARAAACR